MSLGLGTTGIQDSVAALGCVGVWSYRCYCLGFVPWASASALGPIWGIWGLGAWAGLGGLEGRKPNFETLQLEVLKSVKAF